MRVACPNCETAYDVPESVLTFGRVLRCARCRSEWAPEPVAPAETSEPAPPEKLSEKIVAAPAADDPLPFIRAPEPLMPKARPSVMVGWGVSLTILGLLAWSAIEWREPIMRHWPASTRLYMTLGYRKA